jgi:branched-chain amino acid aminotransferase
MRQKNKLVQKYNKPTHTVHSLLLFTVFCSIMAFINLNGKLSPQEDPVLQSANRSFRYGYGLFETMLVKEGDIRLKEYHWVRLWQGMEQLQFSIPKLFTASMLEDEVLKTVKKNKLEKLCRVRLQVFPGNGGLYDGDSFSPEFLVECFPLEEHIIRLNEAGLILGVAEGLAKSNDKMANLKSANGLIYALAARQAKEQKWNDALILNSSEHIIESSIANVFWVKTGKIYTPPLSEGCVAGVMRAYILDKAPGMGIIIEQKALSVAELIAADEVFLTNAIRQVKWVRNIGNTAYGNTEIQRFSAIIF